MRRFVCLLLVACLLFSAWAVPAKAFVITGTAVMGSLGVAVSILAGLGLTVYTIDKISSWSSLVSQAQSHLNDQGLVDSDGNMQLLFSDGLTYLPVSVIQDLKDWLFDSGVISFQPEYISSSFSLRGYTVNAINNSAPVFYVVSIISYPENGKTQYVSAGYFISSSQFGCSGCGTTSISTLGDFYYCLISGSYIASYDLNSLLLKLDPYLDLQGNYVLFSGNTASEASVSRNSYLSSVIISNGEELYSLSDGLAFSDVTPVFDLNIESNYPTWAEGTILSPPVTQPGGSSDDDPIPYIPISVYPYVPENPSIPRQPDVWKGISDDVGNDDEDVPVAPDNTGILSGISSFTKQIVADLSEFKDSVIEWFEVTWAAFVLSLMTALTEIKEGILAIPGLIVDAVSAVGETVKSIWDWLTEVFGLTIQQILDILSAIKDWALGLVDALITALQSMAVKLFVPDVAALEAAVSDLRLQFPFFDSIILTGQTLLQSIGSGSPPVIYAHLGAAEGNYAWGGTVAVLDMSFYSRYKATGDAIISAALYAFFAWRNFVRLPNIISGVGSDLKGF